MDCISEKSGFSSTLGTPQFNPMVQLEDSAHVPSETTATRRSRSGNEKSVRRSFSCNDVFKMVIKSDEANQQPEFGFSSFTMASSSNMMQASSSDNLSTSCVKNLNETYDKPGCSSTNNLLPPAAATYPTNLLSPLVYSTTVIQTNNQHVRIELSPNSQIVNSSFLDGSNWYVPIWFFKQFIFYESTLFI
jgi:hypothetical protein